MPFQFRRVKCVALNPLLRNVTTKSDWMLDGMGSILSARHIHKAKGNARKIFSKLIHNSNVSIFALVENYISHLSLFDKTLTRLFENKPFQYLWLR